MTNLRCTSNHTLIVVAMTAVFSLASAHLVDLGVQLLGSGPVSTPALIGDLAGLLACAASAWLGLRYLRAGTHC